MPPPLPHSRPPYSLFGPQHALAGEMLAENTNAETRAATDVLIRYDLVMTVFLFASMVAGGVSSRARDGGAAEAFRGRQQVSIRLGLLLLGPGSPRHMMSAAELAESM